jgi:hypothetical protein
MRLQLGVPTLIVMVASFASVAFAQQTVVYDISYGFLASTPGGNGSPVYTNKWGQMLVVDGRQGTYLHAKTQDGKHEGWLHESGVVSKDPKSYFQLTIGGQKRNVSLVPRCGSWQDLGRLYDFETDIGIVPVPISKISAMKVISVSKPPGSYSPKFRTTVTLKDGTEMAGTFCGANFRVGSSAELEATEGLDLKPGDRVPWTITSIDTPFK